MDHSGSTISVKFKKMARNTSWVRPEYATTASAGVDLCANLESALRIEPGENVKIPTGLAIELPGAHVVALVFARSGLASRHGLTLVNGVGVIDADYRGEIQVLLRNEGTQAFAIQPGDRIAQMVFMPVFHAVLEQAQELQETARGTGGFGSTGIR